MKRLVRFVVWNPIAAVVVLGACQDAGPTALPEVGESSQTAQTVTVDGVQMVVAPEGGLELARAVSRVIGPSGGSISNDGGRLTIPAGALTHSTRITMSGRVDGLYKYRFGPKGLDFLTPATLTIRINAKKLRRMGLDPNHLAIAVTEDYSDHGYGDGDSDDDSSDDHRGGSHDEYGEDWEIVPAIYDPVAGTITAQVLHFSQYALCLD